MGDHANTPSALANRTWERPVGAIMHCALVTACTATAGCAAGFGAAVGVSVDAGGHVGVMVQGMSRSGSRGTFTPARETATFYVPQLTASAGYDVSRRGLRLQFGMPWLGFARADASEGGLVLGAQVATPFVSLTFPQHGPTAVSGGVGGSLMVGRVLSLAESRKSSFEPHRTFHTAGMWLDAWAGAGKADGGGSSFDGLVFLGGYYEYLDFYDSKSPAP